MTPTTPRELRDAFVPAIKAISPTSIYGSSRWHYTPRKNEVPGADLRTFTIEFVDLGFADSGFYGADAKEMQMLMRVITSYAGIDDERDDSILFEDSVQLENALGVLYDPAVNGLVSVRLEGFESEDDQEGYVLAAHLFTVRYAAPSRL